MSGTAYGQTGCQILLQATAGVYSDAGITPCTQGQFVQQWNDQSGAGTYASQTNATYQMQFNPDGNTPPAVVGVFQNAGGNIAQAAMSLSSGVAYNRQNFTLFMVVEIPSSYNSNSAGRVFFTDGSNSINLGAGNPSIGILSVGGLATAGTAILLPNNRCVIWLQSKSTGTTAGCNNQSQNLAATTSGTTTGGLIFNNSASATANSAAGSLLEMALFAPGLSNAQVSSVLNQLYTKYSITPTIETGRLFMVGDSITLGVTPTAGTPTYVAAQDGYNRQIVPMLPVGTATFAYGVGGETAATLSGVIAALAQLYYRPGEPNIAVLWAGTNDVAAGTAAATIEASITSCGQALQAAGFYVITITIVPRGSNTSPENIVAATVNAWMLANYSTFANDIYDPTTNPLFATYTSSGFAPDFVHLSYSGYGGVAAGLAAKIVPLVPSAGGGSTSLTDGVFVSGGSSSSLSHGVFK